MEKTVIQQFLDLFQDFLNLCQCEKWPENSTTTEELKNALLTSQHIEKCLDKLQKKNLLDSFLTVISENEENSSIFLKYCLADPSKYILRKIINSDAKVAQMDVGFQLYVQIFSENKLEHCLTDLFVEAASANTLLRHLTDIPKEKILLLKSNLLLSELTSSENAKESVLELLKSNDQGIVELLVLSMLNKDLQYHDTALKIKEAFLQILLSKSNTYQKFWKFLFNVEDKCLKEMCMENNDLFKIIAKALIDCSKLLKEQMSAELFYINLTYSELVVATQKMCLNASMRTDFLNIASESCSDMNFWKNML